MQEKSNYRQLNLELDIFEGPLDLLLHLINQLEIDIYDIPIAKITNQYLKYLEKMKTNKIDLASEYFVMAASLMRIKSEMLVPRNENKAEMDDEYEQDPRESLVELLLEYKQIKDVLPKFEKRRIGRANFLSKKPSDLSTYQEKIELKNNDLEIEDLTKAFQKVLDHYELKKPDEKIVDSEIKTVPEKMNEVVRQLSNLSQKELFFTDVLDSKNRQEIVISFLAVLELIKNNQIFAFQSSFSEDILIRLKNNIGEKEINE